MRFRWSSLVGLPKGVEHSLFEPLSSVCHTQLKASLDEQVKGGSTLPLEQLCLVLEICQRPFA